MAETGGGFKPPPVAVVGRWRAGAGGRHLPFGANMADSGKEKLGGPAYRSLGEESKGG